MMTLDEKDFDHLHLTHVSFLEFAQHETNSNIHFCFFSYHKEVFAFKIVFIEAADVIQVEFPEKTITQEPNEALRVELSKIQLFLLDFICTKSDYRLKILLGELYVTGFEDYLCIKNIEKYHYLMDPKNEQAIKTTLTQIYKETLHVHQQKKHTNYCHFIFVFGPEGKKLGTYLLDLGIAQQCTPIGGEADVRIEFSSKAMQEDEAKIKFFCTKLYDLGFSSSYTKTLQTS